MIGLSEERDLYEYQAEHTVEENFCRKKEDIQMKFSCNYCR